MSGNVLVFPCDIKWEISPRVDVFNWDFFASPSSVGYCKKRAAAPHFTHKWQHKMKHILIESFIELLSMAKWPRFFRLTYLRDPISDYFQLLQWSRNNCVPAVHLQKCHRREIYFASNAPIVLRSTSQSTSSRPPSPDCAPLWLDDFLILHPVSGYFLQTNGGSKYEFHPHSIQEWAYLHTGAHFHLPAISDYLWNQAGHVEHRRRRRRWSVSWSVGWIRAEGKK